jgi:uncharacterized membrane protein YraQ (UPF0718 family)
MRYPPNAVTAAALKASASLDESPYMAVELAAPPRSAPAERRSRSVGQMALWSGLLTAVLGARFGAVASPRVAGAELAFVSLFAESLPFLLVGAALSTLLTGRAGARVLTSAARRPRLAAALAPLAGGFLPLCDCGLLPLAREMGRQGAGRSVGAFLAGAPLTNPIVVISTLLAFPGRPGVAVARVGCGLVMAMAVAALVPAPALATSCSQPHDHAAQRPGWPSSIAAELSRSGPTLVAGALAAAVLKAALPTSAFVSVSSQPLLGAVALMCLAFVMSICSQADAFVAAALPVGALPRLAFLVLGPAFDLRLAALYRREFGAGWLLRYAGVVVPVALVAATACATAGLV